MNKIIFTIIFIIFLFNIKEKLNNNNFELNNFYEISLNKKINIGLVASSLKNGGSERSASLICHYFNKVKIFKLFLFTLKDKQKNEYYIDESIERLVVNKNLIKLINQTKIDILLYQLYDYKQVYELNKLRNLKIIIINSI